MKPFWSGFKKCAEDASKKRNRKLLQSLGGIYAGDFVGDRAGELLKSPKARAVGRILGSAAGGYLGYNS